MSMSRAFAFLAIVTCLSTPACGTISLGIDRSDAGQDGAAVEAVAADAAAGGPHTCHDPGYPCPGIQQCKPLQLGSWACFPPGVEP
jgi:hypothetical protein